jgi:hypothetical protein
VIAREMKPELVREAVIARTAIPLICGVARVHRAALMLTSLGRKL